MSEIINKVKESGIISLDLADFKPKAPMVGIDLADNLWQGIALREKDFREWIKVQDWTRYVGQTVFIYCSVDAIIPTWAYMLVASMLTTHKVPFIIGSRDELEKKLIREKINELDLEEFQDGRIIIKGCSDIHDPAFAMSELLMKLQPVARSIMYGEPCSAVPVFKRKKA